MDLLTINVHLTGGCRVDGKGRTVNMVYFDGTVDGPIFRGTILPGGVDTQTITPSSVTLSARYMLEGTDNDGNPCRLFIENNGTVAKPDDPMTTTPTVTTDSKSLSWLEEANLRGTVEGNGEDGVIIHITQA